LKSYPSLQRRFIVIFIVMSLVLFALGATLSMFLAESFREDIANRNQSLSHSIRDHIQAFINYHIGDLHGLRDIIDADDGERYDIQQEIEHITASHPTFELVKVLDGDGRISHLTPYNGELVGLNLSKQPFFSQCNGQSKDHVYWSDSFLSPLSNESAVTLSTPLREGVIAAQLNLARLSEIIHIPIPSSGSFMAVTDRRGIAIVHSEKSTFMESQSLRNLNSVRHGLENEEGSFEEYWRGKKGLASISLMEDSGWMVIIYQPNSEALGIVDRLLKISMGGLLITLLFTFSLMVYLQSHLLAPVRLMGKQTLKIAEGQYDEKVTPRYMEFSEFADSFNTMSSSIKAREEDNQRSEKRFRTLFDEAADAVFLISTEGRVLQANRLACSSLGYTADELKKMHVSDFVVGWSEENLAELTNDIEIGQVTTVEGFHKTRSGGTFPVEVRLAGVELEDEKVIISFARDITRRRAAEIALSESEDQFRNIIESSPMGMILYSLEDDGRLIFTDSNPAADVILGIDTSQLVGTTIEEAFPALAETEVPENFRQVAVKGGRWSSEQVDYDYGGIRGAYEVHAFQTSPGSVAVSFLDITERKKVEDQVRDSERRYRLLADNVSDVIWTMDMDFKYSYISPSVERMRGFTPEEMMEHSLEDSLTEQSVRPAREKLAKHLALAESGGVTLDQPVILELELFRKDGSTMWGEAAATFVGDEEGNPAGIQGVTRDITDRKWAEVELIAYQERLRSLTTKLTLAEEQERRKIATELHDRVIQKLAQTMFKVETLLEETREKAVSVMGEELRDLVNETIEEARLLTFELSPPVLHLLGFNEAVVWLGDQFQKQHGIDCEVKTEKLNIPLDSDIKVLLFQAVRELLNNISKHAQAGYVEVNIAGEGDMIRISIQDDGVGFRQDEIKVKTEDLSGFGLFNIRERMESVGGSMVIDSSPGRGAVIVIIAPAERSEVVEPNDEA